MSEIADIVEDYRQHTRWVGPVDARVAREVPAEVERAIVAYEHAREKRYERNRQYVLTGAQHSLDQVLAYDRLLEQWWGRLKALLPVDAGWYPHNGRIYGYCKVSWGGLELVCRKGWSAWPDPARAEAYQVGLWEGERARRQLAEFCTQTRGALK